MTKWLRVESKRQSEVPSGTASWIDLGLRIQDEQLRVATFANRLRCQRRPPTVVELHELAQRRTKLNSLLNTFLHDARQYLPTSAKADEPPEEQEQPVALGLVDRTFDGLEEEDRLPGDWRLAHVAQDPDEVGVPDDVGDRPIHHIDPTDDELPPEQVKIPLPSSFDRDTQEGEGWGKPVRIELEQRAGRQRDHLNDVREQVALKGFTYAHDWRQAKSQAAITRSRSRLNSILENIRVSAASYSMSRNIYFELGGTSPEFRELKAEDLKGVRSYINHTVRGQTHQPASWIWTLGTHQNEYFDERRSLFPILFHCLTRPSSHSSDVHEAVSATTTCRRTGAPSRQQDATSATLLRRDCTAVEGTS